MNNRIVIINFLLIVFVIFEGFMIFQLWSSESSFSGDETMAQVTPEKFETAALFKKKNTPLSAYNDIVRDNLFAPDRKEFIPQPEPEPEPEPETEPEPEPEPEPEKLDTSRITLFGVIIMDELKKALVSDVDKKGKGASIWVEKGDTVDGFMVESIEKDRVIVSHKEKEFVILLYDDNKPKQREAISQKPVQKVITSGPATIPIPNEPGKSAAPSASPEKEDDEYEIISTPFGDFKRKKQ